MLLILATLTSRLPKTWASSVAEDLSVYHVDPLGDDNSDGHSPATALKTVSKINSLVLPAGATVLFSKGNVWRETLKPGSNHITIGSYGSGALPTITGADRITGLSAARANGIPSHESTGKLKHWTVILETEPTQIFVNDIRGERVISTEAIARDRQWHWAFQKLTVCSIDSEPPIVEASVRDYAIDINNRVGLTVQDIHFARSAHHNILADTLNESIIQRVKISDAFMTGLSASSDTHRDAVTIQGCLIVGCGAGGISFGGRINEWLIQGNVVQACCQLTDSVIGTAKVAPTGFQWTCGIKNWGWGQAGWQGSYTIQNNRVLDCNPVAWALNPNAGHGVGIWIDEVVQPTGRPAIIRNTVARCYSRGCYLEKVDNHDLYYNLIFKCAAAKFSGCLGIQANKYGFNVVTNQPDDNAPRACTGNRVKHNTVVGGWWQLEALCNDQKCCLSNNVIEDNIFCPLPGKASSVYIHGGGANDGIHGQENVYQNNNWGADVEDTARVWGSTRCAKLEMFEAAARGGVINSIPGDPLFINPATDEYRLKSNSPCKDAASNAPLKFDILGNIAPVGPAADVGCYEVQ
jgi:hypothetical protein